MLILKIQSKKEIGNTKWTVTFEENINDQAHKNGLTSLVAKHQPTQVLSGNNTHVWGRVWKAGAALPSGRGTAGTPLDPATPCLRTYPEETVQIPSEDSAPGMLFVVAESGNKSVPQQGTGWKCLCQPHWVCKCWQLCYRKITLPFPEYKNDMLVKNLNATKKHKGKSKLQQLITAVGSSLLTHGGCLACCCPVTWFFLPSILWTLPFNVGLGYFITKISFLFRNESRFTQKLQRWYYPRPASPDASISHCCSAFVKNKKWTLVQYHWLHLRLVGFTGGSTNAFCQL